jgi:TRAP-type C4-dicarboxylate transport system substrate-binding protein
MPERQGLRAGQMRKPARMVCAIGPTTKPFAWKGGGTRGVTKPDNGETTQMKLARGFGAASVALIMGAGIAAAQEVTLSAVYSLPPSNDLFRSYTNFVEDVNENGKGILQIDLRGGVEAIPRNEQLSATSLGIIDIYMGPAGYYQGQLPELAVIDAASVPADKMRAAGVHDALDEAMRAKMGVSLLGLMGTGYAFQFYTISEPTISADGDIDMSGMRIRGGPSYDAMYNALDVIRVDIPAGDIYTALERSVVDGIGFTTIGVSSGGWQEFLRYRIFPTWRQGNTIIAMNAASRDRLTDEQEAFLLEMMMKHEMIAFDMAKELEATDTEALAAAGVVDIHLEGPGAARITAAFQDTFWDSVEESTSAEFVEQFRPIIDAANAM